MSELSRRGFFLGSAAIILTPGVLMPVKKIVAPDIFRFGHNIIPGLRYDPNSGIAYWIPIFDSDGAKWLKVRV